MGPAFICVRHGRQRSLLLKGKHSHDIHWCGTRQRGIEPPTPRRRHVPAPPHPPSVNDPFTKRGPRFHERTRFEDRAFWSIRGEGTCRGQFNISHRDCQEQKQASLSAILCILINPAWYRSHVPCVQRPVIPDISSQQSEPARSRTM